eukprot:scaffold3378_cov93-Isochrysis_galbana.AAC.8
MREVVARGGDCNRSPALGRRGSPDTRMQAAKAAVWESLAASGIPPPSQTCAPAVLSEHAKRPRTPMEPFDATGSARRARHRGAQASSGRERRATERLLRAHHHPPL